MSWINSRLKFDRRFAVATLLVGTLALLASCTSTPRTSASGSDNAHMSASLTDFKIAMAGNAPAGRAFDMIVRNDGKTAHNLAIEGAGGTISTPTLDAGASSTLSVPAFAAGAYTLFCAVAGHRESGMETVLSVGGSNSEATTMSAAEMDRAHGASVKAFPATTQGTGGLVLAPRIVGGVKVFELTTKAVRWEVSPGEFVNAYAFNGQIPGPQLRVRKGDKVRVVLRNELPESTAVHFHGLTVPNAMDGVPFITQDPIKPDETFNYEFEIVDGPGTYMYHSHHNALAQVGKGLFGSFIVEGSRSPKWDQEHTMIVGDGDLGYTLNGKGFPATAPIVAKRGSKVLVRFINAGQMLHPMHLHGFHFTVVARDGRPLEPYVLDTLTIAPGERYEVIFTANLVGTWAFHCHILSHVDSPHGMLGMVTAVVVK